VQPEGPYHLLGLSVGGEIAHEIAVQLQRAGQQVALLAMLDARPTPYRAGTGVARLNAAERPARSTEELFAELRQRQGPYAFLLQQRGRAIVDLYKNMATLMGSHTYSTYDGDVLFVEATAGRAPEQYFAPMWEQYVTGQIEVMALNYVHRGLARAEVLEMIGARVAEHIEGFNHRGG
jgi:thioesterase domain-containing protein